jgi:hypothetical protein
MVVLKRVEDTKGVIRIRKSKKDRQHTGQKKKDRQHTGQKKKDRQHTGQKKKDKTSIFTTLHRKLKIEHQKNPLKTGDELMCF